MSAEERKEFYRIMHRRNMKAKINEDKKKMVEDFLILFSDPVEAIDHFSGQIKDTLQSLLDEINSDENTKKTFTHTMGYLMELAELYYNSSYV